MLDGKTRLIFNRRIYPPWIYPITKESIFFLIRILQIYYLNLSNTQTNIMRIVCITSAGYMNTREYFYWPICTYQSAEFINWLPICPCVYPNEYIYTKTRGQNDTKEYWWQIVTNPKVQEKDIRCTKIEAENNVTLVSKHCCYDTNDFLITRGPNTGNIYYMTKDLTKEIRTTFQLYPTVKCNFLRYVTLTWRAIQDFIASISFILFLFPFYFRL